MALREKPYDFEMELYRVYPTRIPKREEFHSVLYAVLNEDHAGLPAGTPVIIKRPTTRTGGPPRLLREAQSLRLLGGRHAPALIDNHTEDVDNWDGWFSQTFVPHPTLGEIGPLVGEPLDEFVRRSWRALRAIHALQISHRDIAPANILFDPVSGTVTYIDFGNGFVEGGISLTSERGLGNHGGFGAPEHREGRGPDNSHLSQATDLWGWAATVVFACSGRAPYSIHRHTWEAQMAREDLPDLNGLSDAYRALLEPLFDYDMEERLEAIAHVEAHLPRPELELMSEQFDRATLLGVELGAEVQRARDSIRQLSEAKAQLESKVANFSASAAGIEAMAGRLAELQTQLEDQRLLIEKETAAAAAAAVKTKAAKEETKTVQRALAAAATALDDSQDLVDELTQIAREHTVTRDSLAADLTLTRLEAKTAAARYDDAQRRISALEAEKNDLARRVVPGPRPLAVVGTTLGVLALLAGLVTVVVLSARDEYAGLRRVITTTRVVGVEPDDPAAATLTDLATAGRRGVHVRTLDFLDVPPRALAELELSAGASDLDITPASGAVYLLAEVAPIEGSGSDTSGSYGTVVTPVPVVMPQGAWRASGFGVVDAGASVVNLAPDGDYVLLPMDPPDTGTLAWGQNSVAASTRFGGADAPFDTAFFQLPDGLVPLGVTTLEDGTLTGFGPMTGELQSSDRPWTSWSFPDEAEVVETAGVANGTCLSPHLGLTTITIPGRLMTAECDVALWRVTGNREDDRCPAPTTGWVSDSDVVTAEGVHRCVEANPEVALSALSIGSFFGITVRRGPFVDATTGIDGLTIAGLEVEVTNRLDIPWEAGVDDFRLLFTASPSGYQRGDAESSTLVDVYTLGDFDGTEILPGSMRTVYGIRPDEVGHEYVEGNFTSNWYAATLSPGQLFGGDDADGDTMVFSLPAGSPPVVGLAMVNGNNVIAFTEIEPMLESYGPQFFGFPDAVVPMWVDDVADGECYVEPPVRSDGATNYEGWIGVASCDAGISGLYRLHSRVSFADDAELPDDLLAAAEAMCPDGTYPEFIPSTSGWDDGYRKVTCSTEL